MEAPIEILIVDDREDGLVALDAVLSEPHLNLVRASSGMEALSLLPKHDFAVILLDVQMPGIDGFETAARIKLHAGYENTPIIFVTAINKDEAYVYKGYEQGAVDYVFKPFDPRILRSKVSIFIELYRKNRLLEKQSEMMRESERRERYLRLAELEVESLKRYQNLADSIPHAVWRSKADGTMDYFNRVWTQTTGLTDVASLGLGWQSAFHGVDLRKLLKAWMHGMEGGEGFEVECRIRNAEGQWRWHWIRAVAERRATGDVIAWLGTCTDIHERKQVEDRLMQAQAESEAASKAKSQFLANMSHEIRTPLNSILGFAELMMNPNIARSEHFTNLMTIKRNGHGLLKIIDEILDISKVEADRLEIEKIDTDILSILAELQLLLRVQAHDKGLAFDIRCTGPMPSRMDTDPTRLRQILINMVGNAIKFTDKGSVSVNVSWRPDLADLGSGFLVCKVADSGVGVSPEHAARLFQPFMQGDSSTTRKFGGTGLGLALSKRLAQALGGDITLESSQIGQGSVFTVEVKGVARTPLQVIERIDTPSFAATVVAQEFEKDLLEDLDILVVDDAADNRTLLSRFLKGAGANVDFASDGYEGVAKAQAKNYAVILMDIQMPQLDGYAATEILRDGGYCNPIIALTAHALKEERERSLAAGCNDHLTKPIDRRTLIGQVAKFAGRVSASASVSELNVERAGSVGLAPVPVVESGSAV